MPCGSSSTRALWTNHFAKRREFIGDGMLKIIVLRSFPCKHKLDRFFCLFTIIIVSIIPWTSSLSPSSFSPSSLPLPPSSSPPSYFQIQWWRYPRQFELHYRSPQTGPPRWPGCLGSQCWSQTQKPSLPLPREGCLPPVILKVMVGSLGWFDQFQRFILNVENIIIYSCKPPITHPKKRIHLTLQIIVRSISKNEQWRFPNLEEGLLTFMKVVEGHISLICFLFHKHGVSLTESAPTYILPTDPHVLACEINVGCMKRYDVGWMRRLVSNVRNGGEERE